MFKKFSLLLFLAFNTLLSGYDYELAVCTIFKDSTPYLHEWIEFHKLVGVEHFYLYDNESSDQPLTVLQKYIDDGTVTLIDWPDRDKENWKDSRYAWVGTTQKPAMEHAIELSKHKAKWLAMIDTDEFLVPVIGMNLSFFLSAKDDAPGIEVFWDTYGTSGIVDVPEGKLMIELLRFKAHKNHPVNQIRKSIIKPELYDHFIHPPHRVAYLNNLKPYKAPKEALVINHYINRTLNYFFNVKIAAKEKMDNRVMTEKQIKELLNVGNDEKDMIMDKFIPTLKENMNITDGFSHPKI